MKAIRRLRWEWTKKLRETRRAQRLAEPFLYDSKGNPVPINDIPKMGRVQ